MITARVLLSFPKSIQRRAVLGYLTRETRIPVRVVESGSLDDEREMRRDVSGYVIHTRRIRYECQVSYPKEVGIRKSPWVSSSGLS